MCSDRQMKMDCEIQQWQSAVNERRAKMKAHPKPRHSAHYGMAPHAVSADEGGGGAPMSWAWKALSTLWSIARLDSASISGRFSNPQRTPGTACGREGSNWSPTCSLV